MKKTALILAAGALLALNANAQIALYSFGSNGVSDSISTIGMVASDVTTAGTASSISPNTEFGSDFPDEPYARINGSWTGGTAADGGIITFTLTPDFGFQLDITSFDFYVSATGAGPDSIAVSIDGGGFNTVLSSFQGTDATPVSLSVNQTFTEAVTFQISGFAGGTGNMDVDTLAVYGSATAVPEPQTYAAIAGLMVLGLAVYRRRK